VAVDVFDITLV